MNFLVCTSAYRSADFFVTSRKMSEENESVMMSNEEMEKVNGGVAKPNKEGGTTISDGKDQRPKFDLDMDDVEKIRKQLGL